MKYWRLFVVFLSLVGFITAGCQSTPSDQLPLPASVKEAALVNFQPLTTSGKAIGAAWSEDGQSLVYTGLSVAPSLVSYRNSNNRPQTEVWLMSKDQEQQRMLDIGTALFFAKDSPEIYYQIYDPADGTPSIYAIDPATMKTRHFLGTQGFPSVHQLADGRLVLSEVGNTQPLRFFDPSNGELTTLMPEHPSTSPQDARISPDGKMMAYPDQRAVYLSRSDGTSPKLLSNYGGGAAKVWWSPDSKYLAHTTGNALTDQLLLVDRNGNNQTTLLPGLGQFGYISSVEWSPDSRWMLVLAESINEFERPTQILLVDRQGNHQLLLESYLSASPAWSPDGRSIALPLWIDPQGDQPVFDLWLADLTDATTAATLSPSSIPTAKPTPTLLAVPVDISPEQVVTAFWERISQNEYHAAWSMLSKAGRLVQKYPEFKAFYECMLQPAIGSLVLEQADSDTMVYSTQLEYQRDPDCDIAWQQPNEIYILLTKTQSAEPWQIECVSDQPTCSYQAP